MARFGKLGTATAAAWAATVGQVYATGIGKVDLTGGGWDIAHLSDKLSPIVNTIFPVILFVAVIRIMWEGVKMATGSDDKQNKGAMGATSDPKTALFNTVKGVLWIVGAWVVVTLAIQLAQKVLAG